MGDEFKELQDDSTPPIHEGCGGEFFFTHHPDGPFEQRVCVGCGQIERRKEVYDVLTIVGKAGVTEESLRKICDKYRLVILNIGRDKSDPLIITFGVHALSTREIKSLDDWVKLLETLDDIAAVYKKRRVIYEPEKPSQPRRW